MSETLDLILNELALKTYNLDIVDHIKVNPKFLKYLEANLLHQILCEKAEDQPSGMIVKYKGVPLVIDDTIDDYYSIVHKEDSYYGKLVDVKVQPIVEPKTKYDYLFMNKEMNNG